MNKKVSILILSIIMAVVLFIISTVLQKKLVAYVPTVSCLAVLQDIEQYEQVTQDKCRLVDIPIDVVANIRVLKNISEVEDLYLKEKIYKGQLLVFDQFDTKENLMIFENEEGKEKISIKIKSAENGASFVIKKGSYINVYATLLNEYASNGFLESMEKISIGKDEFGYSIFEVLNSVKVLGTFDEEGNEIDRVGQRNIDTILLSVTQDEARIINLLRDVASFNVTEL